MNQGLSTIELAADATAVNADGQVAAKCAVCPHPWADHDRIGARFCTATTTEHHSRGCVCTDGK